jgi:hypothetical protein
MWYPVDEVLARDLGIHDSMSLSNLLKDILFRIIYSLSLSVDEWFYRYYFFDAA